MSSIPEKVEIHVDIESDAGAFCRKQDLEKQRVFAVELAASHFPGTTRVSFSLVEDPYDETATPGLVAEIASPLPRRAFRDASASFFDSLREGGCERLHQALSVIQE